MKKIIKFIKHNYKFIIGFMFGLIVASSSVYAANTIYSKNVTYDNSNSGLSATNVQDALDETYNKCTKSSAIGKIINLYYSGSAITTANIGGSTSNPKVKLNSIKSILLDNNGNYRYYGSNPNNYVTFNDEIWRIIGAFTNIDDGTGNKETRLKIIRNESIGNYSWDSSANTVNEGTGVNDWSKADLMTELNTLYYNSASGNCYIGQNNTSATCNFNNTGLNSMARSMIDNAVYYLGGWSSSYIYADDFYNYERGTTVYNCSTNDGVCPRATTWTGKIRLMYLSDYMYATDLSLCIQNGYNYKDSNCFNNNWLTYSDGVQWPIVPDSSHSNSVFRIGNDGYIGYYTATNTYVVRPVLYLKSNIIITGGSGTSSDPYTLG